MKLVNIVDRFHPNAGYENNVLTKYLSLEGWDITIITAEYEMLSESYVSFFGKDNIDKYDKEFTESTGVKIIRLPIKGFISSRARFTNEIFDVIDSINPDLISICGNDTLISIQYLWKYRKVRKPLVLDSHMLEMASQNPLKKLFRIYYKMFITPIIKKYNYKVIRLQDDLYVEKFFGIPLEQAPFVSFGTDVLLFHPDKMNRNRYRDELNISKDEFLVIYAGKIDEVKGSDLLANLACEQFAVAKKVTFLVVGNLTGEFGQKIKVKLEESKNRIITLPTQKYLDLANVYQSADLVVFPKQCSLSFFDVQACGIPVLFEDNSINIDRSKFGNAITYKEGNLEDFRKKVEFVAEMSKDDYLNMQENAVKYIMDKFDYKLVLDKYLNIYTNIHQQYIKEVHNYE